ncbi:centromere protein O isoform X2 [Tasmannia lanceolata]|uniref:centromere protein O isoform X2 n=1 Tax=Tasmannia lanceolata TaxID=3420 RepID=UPI0040637D15
MESDMEESMRRKIGRRKVVTGDTAHKLEQLKGRVYALTGEVNFIQEEDLRLETTRARLSNIIKRHEELTERLTRDSDKLVFERLRKEFDDARAAQTEEICLDGEQWNDGLLATIRERVHMEADRKAMLGNESIPDPHFHGKITYKVGTKVICCLEGARIGIQYETSFAGDPCDIYHCVLESRSFLEKMSVIEHTVPFFLPIREAENDFLSSNAMKFIDYIGDILQAYCDRREQTTSLHYNNGAPAVFLKPKNSLNTCTRRSLCITKVRLIQELFGNQIGELYHSISYDRVEFVLDDSDCKVTVSLRYTDLVTVLPTRIRVLAWPLHSSKRRATAAIGKGSGETIAQSIPTPLSYAEDALRTLSLPQACTEIILNLPQALQQIFPHLEKNKGEKSPGIAPL